jgi:hypothetical protein
VREGEVEERGGERGRKEERRGIKEEGPGTIFKNIILFAFLL